MTFDEEKYREVSDLVRSFEFEDTNFNMFGIDYYLRITPQVNYETGEQNGEAAEYFGVSDHGFTIYIWEKLGEEIQRPLLFHEIVEVYHITSGMDGTPAHNATLPWEKRFCEYYLTKDELDSYLKFKREHGCNGFEPVSK